MSTNRLGNCQVCDEQPAKYTCPGCEARTCSVLCVKAHKEDSECHGMRNKTAYKPLSKFNNLDLLSDYRLLEDISHSVDTYARDPMKQYFRHWEDLPWHLIKLRRAAHRRNMRLWFLPKHFSRHGENTTFMNWKSQIIEWRIQWLFPHNESGQKSIVEDRVEEVLVLAECVKKVLAENSQGSELGVYKEAGVDGVSILLRAENVKKANDRYFIMDPTLTIKENLEGHTLVEFPVFLVVLKDLSAGYSIITLEEQKAEQQAIERVDEARPPPHTAGQTESSPHNQSKRAKLEIPAYEELCRASQ